MRVYTYCWKLRPGEGMPVELRVTAASMVVAHREVRRFLVDHDGADWTVDGVRREEVAASSPWELPPRPASLRH